MILLMSCCVQSVPQVSMDQAVSCIVHATLMLLVTHRMDTVSALLANKATTVQHVRITRTKTIMYFIFIIFIFYAQLTHQYWLTFAACESGYWGRGCLSKCLCKEISVGCDPVTGQCVCEAGFTGDHCENSKSALFQKVNAATLWCLFIITCFQLIYNIKSIFYFSNFNFCIVSLDSTIFGAKYGIAHDSIPSELKLTFCIFNATFLLSFLICLPCMFTVRVCEWQLWAEMYPAVSVSERSPLRPCERSLHMFAWICWHLL